MDETISKDDVYMRRLCAGEKNAMTNPGEKISISGVSGYFPNSYNVQHFMENLLNKVDLCDDDERRFEHMMEDVPKLSGKIYNPDKFDAGFFGVPELQASWMDPMARLLLERSVEAIMDAGINPEELKGTKTGVFIGCCHSESEKYSFYSNKIPNTSAMTGCLRSMLSHKISYALQLNGPSTICDTACSSGLYAFELAYRSIREGKCDMAIVGASNLCLDPYVTLQFARLGVLNMDTGCRPFDRDATGYTRSEGIVVITLQKEKDCRRIYAKIVHSKVNADGFKEQGITYPSGDDQLQLLKDVFEECKVDPTTLAFVEAHGTGTVVGDPEELTSIDKFFCLNREKPLLIGSMKGNIGHSEPVSGLCSITKMIYAMNFGVIPPNIHFDNPRPDIPALVEKRLCVVTEKTEWPDFSEFGGVNCFGFGGANCHVLLERYNKRKIIKHDDLPRLVCFSGRTKESISIIQDYLCNNKLDYEYIRLIQSIYSSNIPNHNNRGYSILLPNTEIKRSRSIYNKEKKTIYLCFGNEYVHTCNLLKDLEKLVPFKKSYNRCLEVLNQNNVNIQLDKDEPNNILQKVLTTTIIHLGIIEILKACNINYDYLRGYSMGEFTAGYANGSLRLEEALMAPYTISKHFLESDKTDEKLIEKLVSKLLVILDISENKINKMQISKANTYKYGSIEYYLFNLLNPSLLMETYPPFEKNSIVLNADFKCNLNNSIVCLELTKSDSNVEQVLNCIGRLYELGLNPKIEFLFPEIIWPVSRGTPFFSNLVKWSHDSSYYVARKDYNLVTNLNEKVVNYTLHSKYSTFFQGHVIDGRTLFPATGYIVCVWEMLADLTAMSQEDTRIVFENIKFLRATTFSKEGIKFSVIINVEGYFEVVENNAPVVSGRVRYTDKLEDCPNIDVLSTDELNLSQKDIYKELKIRGYHYKGAFKAVQHMHGNKGMITWNSNWIAFLDNMLQLRIMTEDTRSLAVPTGINRLYIDPALFLGFTQTLGEDKQVSCYINEKINTIYTEGIHITGMRASTIGRKRLKNKPVLEVYTFIPNEFTTCVEISTRINMQIILENKPIINIKIFETFNEESDAIQPLSPEIVRVLDDLPLIQPDVMLFSKNTLEIDMKGITLEMEKVPSDRTNVVYIGTNVLKGEKDLQMAISAIDEDGFIISIEQVDNSIIPKNLQVLTKHTVNNTRIYLLRKTNNMIDPKTVNVSNLEEIESWLDSIKTNLKKSQKVILYAENNDICGILGLTNCLRREPNGENISCFFIRDKALHFDTKSELYKQQIEKGMGINVFEKGQWGTYRHLLCDVNSKVACRHFYGSTSVRGDLSSSDWFQGNLLPEDDDIFHIYYAALNFRDVMLASGKLPVESITKNRIEQLCVEGFEFSGRDKNGKRIMGISRCGSNSNMVKSKQIWSVPDHWTLEDAATVPVVYFTVMKSLIVADTPRPGKSILIHSGTGGIGQAALHICEYLKYDIFVTVGTDEKREYLLENYAFLKASHIGNSRNTSFEEMIFRETNGKGVDIVLNSLSEEKLHASIRCLCNGGIFLEIGKYDLSNDTNISADLLRKGCTYQGIMLDAGADDFEVFPDFQRYLNMGVIKPLKRTIFKKDDLEDAFRYMTTGKHIGKVLVKIREEEKGRISIPKEITHQAHPRFYCDPNLSYVIIGGLGGFGLELADWLMLRGAKHLVLSSRHGITNGYQKSRMRNWINNGLKILILCDDITTSNGCKNLINKSNELAPIAAIFNLAVELRDGLLENLTHADFTTSLGPKAHATLYLDRLTRELCPNLQYFVIFSSVSCGRGNAGQTNYGMSNSIMERICERRKREGYPALAVQWGAIGDVGLVADMQKDAGDIAIGGTLQQRISSCLGVLDTFLQQSDSVVSSIIVAEKFNSRDSNNLVGAVLNMLGLFDLKTISLNTSLAELGMDSMMAIEIKQTLERDYDVFLSVQDMRTITFAKLIEINDSKEAHFGTSEKQFDVTELLKLSNFDEINHDKTLVECFEDKDESKQILILPGIEGSWTNMAGLMSSMKYRSTCMQYKMRSNEHFDEFINHYCRIAENILQDSSRFNIIAHSFGGILALRIASRLEERGRLGKIVLLDSSPDYMLELIKMIDDTFGNDFEIKLMLRLMESYIAPAKLLQLADTLKELNNNEERKKLIMETLPKESEILNKYLYETGQSIFYLLVSLMKEKFNLIGKIKSKILLCKPKSLSLKNMPEDYYISKYVENFEIAAFDGDHMTILTNMDMHTKIKEFFC